MTFRRTAEFHSSNAHRNSATSFVILLVPPVLSRDTNGVRTTYDRNNALASILCSCSRLAGLNLSWNDLRTVPRIERKNDPKTDVTRKKPLKYNERVVPRGVSPFASAALVHPGRLVSLELPFNGLADTFGVRTF